MCSFNFEAVNPRSLKSVLILLSQILGPLGQIWVFYKFGWVFYKFTENGEFFNGWFLPLRGKNRDACHQVDFQFERHYQHYQMCNFLHYLLEGAAWKACLAKNPTSWWTCTAFRSVVYAMVLTLDRPQRWGVQPLNQWFFDVFQNFEGNGQQWFWG